MNKVNSIYVFLKLAITFFLVGNLYSQTSVGGNIDSTTTWYTINSPYELHEDIYIRDGATLTIENGVTVNFQNRYLFVGLYKSGEIIADGAVFNNGTITFNLESSGNITNSTFYKTRLYLEEYSFPDVQQNIFDEDSPIFIHSPDGFQKVQNNEFSNGNIIFSFDIEYDINVPFIENCLYHVDNDIYIGNDASLNIDKSTTIYLYNRSIYVGNYSDGYLNATEVNLNRGWIRLSDNSVGQFTSNNMSRMNFEIIDSAKLTIFNSNLDSTSTINNTSTNSVEAINNYWGRTEGPIMNDSVTVLIGDVNYIPFSAVPLEPITGIIENKTITNDYELLSNYPNPFNPTTTIKYNVDQNNSIKKSNTIIKVYDLMGREIKTLVNKYHEPGNYSITFDASNLSSGFYIYQLKHGSFIMNNKMLYLK